MTKKIFAMFLAVLMVVSMLPTSVFAAEATCPGEGKHTLSNCEYTVVKVTPPTCGVDGHTSYQCVVCEEIFAESVVPATGEHTWEASEGKAPTCGEYGWEGGMECSECGALKDATPIAPLHKEGTPCEWVDMTPNINCETGGQKEYQCAACGAPKKGEEYEPGEHSWAKWDAELITPATPEASGLAKVYCYNCDATKEVEVLYAHECEKYFVEEVKPTCTTDGMGAHWKCRICGDIFLKEWHSEAADEEQIQEYLLDNYKGGHTFAHTNTCQCADKTQPHVATCVDTVLYCSVCEKTVSVSIAHEVSFDLDKYNWNGKGDYVPATCTTSGYISSYCTVCEQYRDVKILPAVSHRAVTVTVPATCGTFAYTFTYCTRENCNTAGEPTKSVFDKYGIEYNVMVDSLVEVRDIDVLKELKAEDEGFYMALNQDNLGKTLYFNGKMDGYYMATTDNVAEAVVVYLENLANYRNRYFLYFFNEEGVKTYITIAKVGYYTNAVLTEEVPETFFQWNSEKNVLTTTIGSTEYYLGSMNSYTTAGPYAIKNFEQRFPMYPYSVGEKVGVNLISEPVFDYEKGYDAENHAWDYELGSMVPPTCTTDGSINAVCKYCFKTVVVTLPAEHTFVPVESATVTIGGKEIPASIPATCVDGYEYYVCAVCGEYYKDILPALGHDMTEDVYVPANHKNLVGYLGIGCAYCDHVVKYYTWTWEYAGYYFETEDDAKAAHDGCELINKTLIKAGDCDNVGLYRYTCAGCGKYVYVKQWLDLKDADGNVIGTYITGEHVGHRENHKDATCLEAGWHITYECGRCGKIVGNKALGQKEDFEKLEHNWVEDPSLEYEAADCAKPNFYNWKYTCTSCGQHKNDGTKRLANVNTLWQYDEETDTSYKACEGMTYTYYECHCGEEHMINFNVFKHNWIKLAETKENSKAPTCYAEGYYTVMCEYCKVTAPVSIPKVEHTNVDGDKFTDKCTDTETDRHCVVCCEYYEHDKKGNEHDCYKKDDDGNYICEGEKGCMIPTYCHWIVAEKRPSTCTMDAHTLYVCGDCTDEKLIIENAFEVDIPVKPVEPEMPAEDAESEAWEAYWEAMRDFWAANSEYWHDFEVYESFVDYNNPEKDVVASVMPAGTSHRWNSYVWFNGHKPAEVDYVLKPVYDEETGDLLYNVWTPEEYASYDYVNIAYQYVVIDEEGEFDYRIDFYNAKFLEYKAPTYTEDGYAKMYCQICDMEVTQVLPKLEGIGFELNVENANGTGNDYTYGSLVEVTVSVNGNDELVHGFDFGVVAQQGLTYVGYELLNENFVLTVTEPGNTRNAPQIKGYAANDVSSKMQNIAINEKTDLVKLYFRVNVFSYADYDCNFYFNNAKAYIVENNAAEQVKTALMTNYGDAEITVREFLNFNCDNDAHVTDLYLAMSLLTGEHPDGKTYDVTVDMNKDGVITLEDLSIAYNYMVGNYKRIDLFKMGMSEEEIELLGLNNPSAYCYNCGEKLAEAATFCSHCGLKQPTE